MDKFAMSSSPHVRASESTRRIMIDVIIALLPATVCGVYFFGIDALWIILVCVASAVGTEAVLQKLMRRKVTALDGSAALTGLLLALNLPVMAPGMLWLPFVGAAFAIAIVKQAFGGIGSNFLNPALAARALLMVSWPTAMTTWTMPVDAVSAATPLAALKYGGDALSPYLDMAVGNVGGTIGETSAIALIIGGLYLLIRRVIDWRIPGVFIATVALFTFIAGPEGLFTGDALYHMLGGGLMLGAIYMATDYSSAPMSNTGKIIFALGCGILTSVIRLWGGFPEGVSYSILLMNLVVPLLDKAFKPKLFGTSRRRAKFKGVTE
ncbi:MAG: RnfABCDGE type electron transport complex subunit D [Clostridia bacterium]|jgi:Na+-translocating ferredoxin:NAD+ oxidoreductase subunit D|nr:RnfABCDGE type electron transport complex subunit D [Clostridia bacterium]